MLNEGIEAAVVDIFLASASLRLIATYKQTYKHTKHNRVAELHERTTTKIHYQTSNLSTQLHGFFFVTRVSHDDQRRALET